MQNHYLLLNLKNFFQFIKDNIEIIDMIQTRIDCQAANKPDHQQ